MKYRSSLGFAFKDLWSKTAFPPTGFLRRIMPSIPQIRQLPNAAITTSRHAGTASVNPTSILKDVDDIRIGIEH